MNVPNSVAIHYILTHTFRSLDITVSREHGTIPTGQLHVTAGLDYLHSAGIMHCNLKPGNVLLKSTVSNQRGYTCKLSDFGVHRLLTESATHVSTPTCGVRFPSLTDALRRSNIGHSS